MLILLFQLKKENQQVRKAYFGSNRKGKLDDECPGIKGN